MKSTAHVPEKGCWPWYLLFFPSPWYISFWNSTHPSNVPCHRAVTIFGSYMVVGSIPAKTPKTENSNLHGFELHRPSSKGTKLLLQVIKAIINQSSTCSLCLLICFQAPVIRSWCLCNFSSADPRLISFRTALVRSSYLTIPHFRWGSCHVKTARCVLLRHSVATSLLEITSCAWMSASSFARSPRCAFIWPEMSLLLLLFFSRPIRLLPVKNFSASGAPTQVAFPPSPTHLFTAFSSASLSHKYSMVFIIGAHRASGILDWCWDYFLRSNKSNINQSELPPNAKTKAASSGQFELDPSSSSPLLPFPFPPQVHITCSHLPPFLVRSITHYDCASEALTP